MQNKLCNQVVVKALSLLAAFHHSEYEAQVVTSVRGSRDGAIVRALASHQCSRGSILRLDVTHGLSLLLVLVFALRGFSPGSPLSSKTNKLFDLASVPN